jgi:hypothetical protein
VPLYSKADGALYVDFLDAPTFALGAGSATIGGVTQAGTWSVGITGSPTFTVANSTLAVTQSGAPWSFSLSGSNSVSVSNFPSTQAISGTVTVGNSSIPVTGTFYQSTQPVSGTFWPYALGQQTASASVPVILPSATITALTPPTTVTVQQSTPANLQATVTPASGATFPISGSITATNPSVGATGSAVPSSATYIAGKNGSGNATGIAVDGSGNVGVNVQNTVAITASSLPLPTGAATASAQATGNGSLSTIATNTGNIPAQGQALGANSLPVVLPAAQITALTPPTSVTVNAGTNTSTAGLATSANQSTELSSLSSIATSVANIPSSPATAANQATANSSLSTIATNTGTIATNQTSGNEKTQPVDANGNPLQSVVATVANFNGFNFAMENGGVLGNIYAGQTNGNQVVQPGQAINTTFSLAANGSTAAFPYSTTALPNGANLIYASVRVALAGSWSGTCTFQASNDGSTWYSQVLNGGNTGSPTPTAVNAGSADQIYSGNLYGQYFRVTMSSYTSGTATGTIVLSTLPFSATGTSAVQSGTWTTVPVTSTSGGATVSKVLTTASTNLTALKTTAGQLYGYDLTNTSSGLRYLHFGNASGTVTVGTTSPYYTVPLPIGHDVMSTDVGKKFTSGMEYWITAGSGDLDATATAAGDVVGEVDYD